MYLNKFSLPIYLVLLVLLISCASPSDQVSTQQLGAQAGKAAAVIFVGSANSNKYHRPNCEWAKKIKPGNEVTFPSASDAEKAHYIPCKVCRPPTAEEERNTSSGPEPTRVVSDIELAKEGMRLFKAKRFDEAAASLENAVAANPKNPEAWLYLGFSYSELSKHEKAVDAFKLAIEGNQRDVRPYIGLARTYGYLGRFQDSADVSKLAIGLEPSNELGHFYLGVALIALEDLEKAYKEYKILSALNQELAHQLYGFLNQTSVRLGKSGAFPQIELTEQSPIPSTDTVETEEPQSTTTDSTAPAQPSSTPAPSPPTTITINPAPAPAHRAVPAGASAICRDGTYSYSQSRRGTCSHHGGVQQWLY